MKSKINKTCIFAVCIWVIVTLFRVAFHQPWYDESQAYIIARELPFLDIIALMKYEGHTFLWYLLLMPFAKFNFWYPYPMLIMNWIFCFIAILIFWKKAPLHSVTKIFVTFSYPFLAQLPVVARCYAIGVMFLFILTAMYKNRLKSPLIFASCITLCANTSVMALFGAAAFGFIFAYDLIKGALGGTVSRKDFRLAFIVMAACAVLILWQLGGANSDFLISVHEFIPHFIQYAFNTNLVIDSINFIALTLAIIFIPIYVFSDKRVLFFFCFTVGSLLGTFMFKYAGWGHHYIFFWIYFLITIWLFKSQNTDSKRLSAFTEVVIALLFLGQIFISMNFCTVYFTSASKYIANSIFSDKNLIKNRLILYHWSDKRILPYTSDKLDIRFYCSADVPNYDASMNIGLLCYSEKDTDLYAISPSWLHRSLSKNKPSFLVTIIKNTIKPEGFIVEDKHYRIILEPYKIINKTYGVFKITEIKK